MAVQRRTVVGTAGCALALFLLCVALRPSVAPGELQAVRAHSSAAQTRSGQARLVALLEGKPANLPPAYSQKAERVRIETAIKVAAQQLDQEKEHKARLEAEHQEALEEYLEKDKVAKDLLARSQEYAQQAVEKHTLATVETDKAETDGKEEQLERKVAELMAYKAQTLRERAAAQVGKEQDAARRAAELKEIVQQLERIAAEKGEHADAVVASARGLLRSAREMAREAEAQAAGGVAFGAAGADMGAGADADAGARKPLLARMKESAAVEKKALAADQRQLAAAELRLKKVQGGSGGVDESSRAQEAIEDARDAARELSKRSRTAGK
jgi:hypothetical protein